MLLQVINMIGLLLSSDHMFSILYMRNIWQNYKILLWYNQGIRRAKKLIMASIRNTNATKISNALNKGLFRKNKRN